MSKIRKRYKLNKDYTNKKFASGVIKVPVNITKVFTKNTKNKINLKFPKGEFDIKSVKVPTSISSSEDILDRSKPLRLRYLSDSIATQSKLLDVAKISTSISSSEDILDRLGYLGMGDLSDPVVSLSKLSDIAKIPTSISRPDDFMDRHKHLGALSISVDSKSLLTETYLNGQISILEESTKLSPIMDDISRSSKLISDYVASSSVNLFNSPTGTHAFINRLNKLPDDYHLELPSETEDKKDIYVKKQNTDSKMSFNSAVSSLGILDLIKNITEKEVIDFYSFLSKYPMLGLHHEVGNKIWKLIEEATLTTLEKDTVHYRARVRPLEQQRPFTENEMWEAPHGLPGHGRFNPIGQSALYTSEVLRGAASEIITDKMIEKIDVIKWTLKEEVKVLNMLDDNYPLLKYCQFNSTSDTKVKPEYLIPNFIAQCCMLHNITGLKFISNSQSDSYNYVFFYFSKGWFEFKEIIPNYKVH